MKHLLTSPSQEPEISSIEKNIRVGDGIKVHLRQTTNGLITSRGRVTEISSDYVDRVRTDSFPENFHRVFQIKHFCAFFILEDSIIAIFVSLEFLSGGLKL